MKKAWILSILMIMTLVLVSVGCDTSSGGGSGGCDSSATPTPTPTPTPIPSSGELEFQAENTTLYSAVVENDHTGHTGSGYVNFENATGSGLELTVYATASGNAELTFRFANGASASRPMDIAVNGTTQVSALAFNATGAWTTWVETSTTVYLNSGMNQIKMVSAGSEGGPNMDKIVISGYVSAPPDYTLTVYINGSGSVSPYGGTYSAGTSVTLTATPDPGWVFVSWSGAASGSRRSVTVTMTGDLTVTANFEEGSSPSDGPVVNLNGYYRIVNRNSGKTACIYEGLVNNGTTLHQWEYLGNAYYDQQWAVRDTGDGDYKLINKKSGKALDENGSDAIQYEYWGGTNQKWVINDLGTGYYSIISADTGNALSVTGGSTANGANVGLSSYTGATSQQWAFTPITGTINPSLMNSVTWQAEELDRGVCAIMASNGVLVSWRLTATDNQDIAFNVYRGSIKLNTWPITGATTFLDVNGSGGNSYTVKDVLNGYETGATASAYAQSKGYIPVSLQKPSGGRTPAGTAYTYSANDCSVGDLDADGEYEIVVKWDPSNAQDNANDGYTGNVYLDGYKLNGTRLWRIDLGVNIRAGAHYTQFIVYDLDGDGDAEVACRTSDGSVDGQGNVIGTAGRDYRTSAGRILSGNEYLTVFSGANGRALETVTFEPNRGSVSDWGDSYGNRVDRFLAGVAYLDGTRPSLIMARGYYAKSEIAAYDYRGGDLSLRWLFSSDNNSSYKGQGNHQLSIADVDSDGKDEIIYGSAAINDNGTGLYNTGLGHGDALHVGDFNPDRSGLEVYACHEQSPYGATFRDARTGTIIYRFTASSDTGRATAGDISPFYKGAETWAAGGVPLATATGTNIGSAISQKNFVIWWDGDEVREILDDVYITKYGGGTLLTADGLSNNGTKATPNLSADIIGDWREEAVFRNSDSTQLRIYVSPLPTNRRMYTLMHDRTYRCAIAWQNVAYNQPPHPGFFMGHDITEPPMQNVYYP